MASRRKIIETRPAAVRFPWPLTVLTTRGGAREALAVMPGGAEDCRCGCRDQGYEDLGYHCRPPSTFWLAI